MQVTNINFAPDVGIELTLKADNVAERVLLVLTVDGDVVRQGEDDDHFLCKLSVSVD